MSELSDQLLLHSYLRGDGSAFDALFRRYAARVHATAYRLTANWEDAEDTLQEVFVELARKAATIRCGAALSSWLYRSTVNRALDRLRRRRATVSLDVSTLEAARVIAIESLRREAERAHTLVRDRLFEQIEAHIPCLPERQAAVFVLRYFQGLPHREIAAILGCTEGSSKSHLSLACRALRARIAEEDRKAGGESSRRVAAPEKA
ncbi:MAG: sigma-70 family RNA polymerase sigma factor [Candidatus Sumerlaeota bacterium]|nr:sigma-70 family RNA polymerase sigma factor [Candidatus Sumerlaeota bacterium]